MSDKLVDYTVYDSNLKRYRVKVPQNKVAVYNMDHLASYRLLNLIKKGKIPTEPTAAALDDLRSPVKKKSKSKPIAAKRLEVAPHCGDDDDFRPLNDNDPVEPSNNDMNMKEDDLNKSFSHINVIDDLDNWADLEKSKFENITASDSFAGNKLPHNLNPATSTPCRKEVNNNIVSLPPDITVSGDNVVAVETEDPKYCSSWTDENAVHALINAIGRNMYRLKAERNHTPIWQDISNDLLKLHFKFSGQDCRAKKRSLESTYYKLHPKVEESGKVTWPFYEGMKHIVTNKNWPSDFVSKPALKKSSTAMTPALKEPTSSDNAAKAIISSDETPHHGIETSFEQDPESSVYACPTLISHNEGNNTLSSNIRQEQEPEGRKKEIGWNYTDSDLVLVQQYYEVKATKPDVVRNDMIFFYVASELQKCSIFMSMMDVKRRFTDLQTMFRTKVDKQKQTGTGGFSDPLYDLFLTYLQEDHPSINAAVTVSVGSVGSSTKVTRFDTSDRSTTACSSSRTTKKRPPTNNRQERASRLMGPSQPGGVMGSQNRALNIQEQKLQLEAQFVSDFSLMRQDMKAREKTILASLELLREIRDGRKSLSPQDK